MKEIWGRLSSEWRWWLGEALMVIWREFYVETSLVWGLVGQLAIGTKERPKLSFQRGSWERVFSDPKTNWDGSKMMQEWKVLWGLWSFDVGIMVWYGEVSNFKFHANQRWVKGQRLYGELWGFGKVPNDVLEVGRWFREARKLRYLK